MAKPKIETPVVSLLRLAWGQANEATSHSWERLNSAMQKALELAVGAGFPFEVEDLRSLGQFCSGRWIGDDEWVYSLAVAEGNLSAAKAYEEWKSREPVIADDVTPANGRGYAHSSGTRQSERLHVGCRLTWQGHKVKVTSFTGGVANAVSYRPHTTDKNGYAVGYESKVAKRFKIDRAAVIADRADRKERSAIHTGLMALVEAEKYTAKEILAAIGAKTKEDFATLPIKRLRETAAELAAAK